MLASVCRRCRPPQAVGLRLPFLLPRRCYAQQKVARTPRSAPQQTTTAPSPTSQVKNRSLPSTPTTSSSSSQAQKVVKKATTPGSSSGTAGTAGPAGIAGTKVGETKNEKDLFTKVRMEKRMREMEETGDQLEMLRMSYAAGLDPWSSKAAVMDLQIPPLVTDFGTLKTNINNNFQNMLSMYRLATDFAFPGIITKWRYSPQLFRTKSTSNRAWVAPFRLELLDVYKRINEAIATGDKKTLRHLTAYEYQQHAYQLLQRNLSRLSRLPHLPPGCTYKWTLHQLLTPVQIVSLRAYPLYSAPEEPKYGNRNCVQALVKFESLQSLVLRDGKGRAVRSDGSVVSEQEEERGWKPEKKRVLEYLICENKMFYTDGWYVRDQVFEGVKPKFHSTGV